MAVDWVESVAARIVFVLKQSLNIFVDVPRPVFLLGKTKLSCIFNLFFVFLLLFNTFTASLVGKDWRV